MRIIIGRTTRVLYLQRIHLKRTYICIQKFRTIGDVTLGVGDNIWNTEDRVGVGALYAL